LAHFGNLIESKSDETSTAIYESNWVESDETYKKNILLTMINVKVPLKVKAAKIFDVNLPNFLFVRFLNFKISKFITFCF
jgi:tRNA threonylcarbamoyladenosine modification (KEOPS) complex  Pcc1 subunit